MKECLRADTSMSGATRVRYHFHSAAKYVANLGSMLKGGRN